MSIDESELLGPLLRDVSRSFYKTLKILPASIRKQISLAYLLARTTDTIADTELIPVEQRLDALDRLRRRILGTSAEPISFAALVAKQGSPAEALVLEKASQSTALLDAQSEADRALIRRVLEIITSGQELDLKCFAGGTAAQPIALQTADDLDDYTYRVAGCVGEFWTRICRAHIFPHAALDDQWLVAKGVRFGKGLQLINVLRDVPADLRKGRCYLPADGLARFGLQPRDMLETKNEPRARPLYNEWLERAEAHLAAGWEYTNALPWRAARVRLACALPILIGVETLALLKGQPILDPDQRIKISRSQVKRAFRRSVLYYPLPAIWKRLPGDRFISSMR